METELNLDQKIELNGLKITKFEYQLLCWLYENQKIKKEKDFLDFVARIIRLKLADVCANIFLALEEKEKNC